jgi:peptidoglycan/LPS O-acetylase OafA/YrhL
MPFYLNPVNPLFAVAVTLAALWVSSLLVRLFGNPPAMGRFSSLDGLRGFLVIAVFIHHSSIWYFYLHSGKWETPPSHLFTHLGQSSVALFFMITAFLFTSKLLNGHETPIDWLHVYISRILRLSPLYLVAVTTLFVIVFASTPFSLNESFATLAGDALQWLTFTIVGEPDLNGLHQTFIVVAGVTWSLPYECLFYAALPLGALMFGLMPSKRQVMWGVIAFAAIGLAMHDPDLIFFATFSGGIAAAFCVRSARICALLSGNFGTWLTIACFSLAVIAFPKGFDVPAILLLSTGFIAVACGNTLFGMLVLPSARLLGDISYGIYLLHGILLFVTFHFIETIQVAAAQSVAVYWLTILCLTPVLVMLCYVTFRFIEYPAIKSVPRVRRWVGSVINRTGASPRTASDK